MKTFDFTVKKGDTYEGVFFQLLINEVPVNLTGVNIVAEFKKTPLAVAAYTMNLDNDKIVVTNAAEGRFKFDKQKIELPAGKYLYDVQFVFLDESVKTYISGTMTVEQDITNIIEEES